MEVLVKMRWDEIDMDHMKVTSSTFITEDFFKKKFTHFVTEVQIQLQKNHFY